MAKYKLLSGCGDHTEGSGLEARTYKAGDIIETSLPLDTMFINKFAKVEGGEASKGQPLVREHLPDTESNKDVYDSGNPAAKKPAKKGSERQKRREAKAAAMEAEAAETDTDVVTADDEAAAATGGLGEDVTEDFPEAEKASLKVFKNGTDYFVTDEDATDTALSDSAGIKRTEVADFISSQLQPAPKKPAKKK